MSSELRSPTRTGIAPAATSCCLFSSEWVMLSSAPVAFLWTRMSLDRASRVRGTSAPDLAILFLLSSGSVRSKNEVGQSAGRSWAPVEPDCQARGRRAGLTVRGEVGDASYGVALNLHVG